jgi:hypothetical protein
MGMGKTGVGIGVTGVGLSGGFDGFEDELWV